jgi:hypothetical protein
VVEDVVVVVAPVLPVFAAFLVLAAGSAVDDTLASLPPAGDPSAMTAPRRGKVSSAPTLRVRNLMEPPPIAMPRLSTHRECPEAHGKVNFSRPGSSSIWDTRISPGEIQLRALERHLASPNSRSGSAPFAVGSATLSPPIGRAYVESPRDAGSAAPGSCATSARVGACVGQCLTGDRGRTVQRRWPNSLCPVSLSRWSGHANAGHHWFPSKRASGL